MLVVLEARRKGRRPRYHLGEAQGVALGPPQCNLGLVGVEVRQLDGLPVRIRRPWTQLCRRCWRGSPELAAALEQREVARR